MWQSARSGILAGIDAQALRLAKSPHTGSPVFILLHNSRAYPLPLPSALTWLMQKRPATHLKSAAQDADSVRIQNWLFAAFHDLRQYIHQGIQNVGGTLCKQAALKYVMLYRSLSTMVKTFADSGAPMMRFPRMPDALPSRRQMLVLSAWAATWPALAAAQTHPGQPTGAPALNQAASQGPDGLTQAELTDALHRLQQAVASGDAKRVAAMVSFPLQVNLGKHSRRWTRARFLTAYGQLFGKHLQQVLADQTPQTLFRNSRGAMVGNGEIWLSGVCRDKDCRERDVKVIAINSP